MKTQQVQQAIYIALWENLEGLHSYGEAHRYWNYLNSSNASKGEKDYAWEKAGIQEIMNLAN